LESVCACKRTVGSNPTPSAMVGHYVFDIAVIRSEDGAYTPTTTPNPGPTPLAQTNAAAGQEAIRIAMLWDVFAVRGPRSFRGRRDRNQRNRGHTTDPRHPGNFRNGTR
jgi:hypothetical protein